MKHSPDFFKQSLLEIPKVSPEVYVLLDDFIDNQHQAQIMEFDPGLGAEAVSHTPISFDEDKRNALVQICITLQDLDRDIGSYLQSFQEDGVLSPDEVLALNTYFLVSKQINPEAQEVRDSLYQGNATLSQFVQKVTENVTSSHVRALLNTSYQKKYFPKESIEN
jgi:hypothetical protein